jgi:L-amino acid N-acyltransferase YncA
MIPFEVIALSPYAREMLAEIANRRERKRFQDAVQRVIEIGGWEAEDWTALSALYDSFFTSGDRARTFPPLNAQQRASWLEELTSRGPNFVARSGNRIVGHAALVAYDAGLSHELVLFVHPDYRGAGIGGALLDSLVQLAPRARVSRIWMVAEGQHASSSALYESRGFRRDRDHVPGRELWTLDVTATSRQWQRTEQLLAKLSTATRVRLFALLRAVRLVMIPLVCAVIIAVVSGDTHGRFLALILAAASLVFGIGVQMRAIVFGQPSATRAPNADTSRTGEWLARLR